MSEEQRKPDADETPETDETGGQTSQGQTSQGQVSEVAAMDPAAADTPISDDQAVAGYPDSESGAPDEPEEAGPNAKPGENRRDNRS